MLFSWSLPVWTLLVSCFAADEANFPTSFANLYCFRVEECARGVYESEFGGEMAECVEEWTDLTETLAENSDEFDTDDAVECLDKLRAETCGEWAESEPSECSRVYAITLDALFE